MPLKDGQCNLGLVVTPPPVGSRLRLEGDLSAAVHDWLGERLGSRGYVVRRRRLESRARLTLAAASRAGGRNLLDEYVGAYPTPSAHATLEALRFLDFARARTHDALVACVARFERAIVDAAEERSRLCDPAQSHAIPGEATLRLHPWRVVVMPARTEDVIVSVALGETITVFDRTPVIVGPGLPVLWRDASPAEDVLCSWLVRPRTMNEVARAFPGYEATAASLVCFGVASCTLD